MAYRDGIFAVLALAVSSLALAGVMNSDDFSRAAQAEATGFDALTRQVFNASPLQICANDSSDMALPPELAHKTVQ